jgi:hypothetical protein
MSRRLPPTKDSRPELDNEVLLAYLDRYKGSGDSRSPGGDDLEVAAHLHACPHCRGSARKLAGV